MLNEQEVLDLRSQVFEDGKVTKEEVIMLWDKKDEQTDGTIGEFDSLFAEAGLAYLTADGKIDDEEAQFLIDKINEDDDIDDAEQELLEAINDWKNEDDSHVVSELLIDAFPEYFEEDEDEE